MIAPALVHEIRRLLAEDRLSQRKIAKRLGVSRGTVGAIAAGRRPDYVSRQPAGDDLPSPGGPPELCRRCGGMVYMPCRLCRTRDMLAANPRPRLGVPETDGALALRLEPEHEARYQQVRFRGRDAG